MTPTPATHRRVIGRAEKTTARDLRDAFGWSLPFAADLLPEPLLRSLLSADVVEQTPTIPTIMNYGDTLVLWVARAFSLAQG